MSAKIEVRRVACPKCGSKEWISEPVGVVIRGGKEYITRRWVCAKCGYKPIP